MSGQLSVTFGQKRRIETADCADVADKKARIALIRVIRAICVIRGSFPSLVCYAFPVQSGFFEIQQQGHLQAGDVQIAQHLGEVRVVERGGDFGIDDYQIVYGPR
jgi:hypothetical protein